MKIIADATRTCSSAIGDGMNVAECIWTLLEQPHRAILKPSLTHRPGFRRFGNRVDVYIYAFRNWSFEQIIKDSFCLTKYCWEVSISSIAPYPMIYIRRPRIHRKMSWILLVPLDTLLTLIFGTFGVLLGMLSLIVGYLTLRAMSQEGTSVWNFPLKAELILSREVPWSWVRSPTPSPAYLLRTLPFSTINIFLSKGPSSSRL